MKIVQSILARNGLQHPDGRPLYAYGVTDAERETLGSFLRMRIAMGGLTPSRLSRGRKMRRFCPHRVRMFN